MPFVAPNKRGDGSHDADQLLVRNYDLALACVDDEYGEQLRRSRGT
jgi:hypothetical protein